MNNKEICSLPLSSLNEINNNQDRQHIKLGLGRIKSCLNHIGNPEKAFKSVLIGGTNGKGSVTFYLSNLACKYSNLKVGRYTSPHLIFFNERFVINETPIGNEALNDIAHETLKQIKEFESETDEKLTIFEVYTVIALNLFAKEKVDLAFLEVGMGGRLDATNVVDSNNVICSIITNVTFDHMDKLGSHIEDIAYEKAGIIKENNLAITGANGKALEIIENKTRDLNSGLLKLKTTTPEITFIENNQGIALTAWKLISEKLNLNETITDDKISFLKSLQYGGRFQLLEDKFLIDCAHNPDGAKELNKLLNKEFPDKKKIFIIGLLDKDYKGFIGNLIPEKSTVICTEPASYRATKKEIVAAEIKTSNTVYIESNIQNAIQKALSLNPELIVITGSIYLAGEAIKAIVNKEY